MNCRHGIAAGENKKSGLIGLGLRNELSLDFIIEWIKIVQPLEEIE